MQVGKEELRYQQAVLKHLGFYKGKLDGIWSAGSIEAKKKFEYTREFSPAIPTNGLPFGTAERLPKGLFFQRVNNHTFLHNHKLSADELKAMLGTPEVKKEEPAPVIESGPVMQEPVVAEVITPAVETQEIEKPAVETKPVQNNQRPNQPHGNRR